MFPLVYELAVVDNRDEVIGYADYEKIHANGLLHRFVLVYVFDQSGRFFLQKRASIKPHGNLLAESICAHVRYGEDYIETVKRRMKEELGITEDNVKSLSEVTKTRVNTEEHNWKNYAFAKIYECIISDKDSLSINKSEIQEGVFYPLEEVKNLFYEQPNSFVPGFKETFSAYLKAKKIQ